MFHAAQNDFYGSKFKSNNLSIEFEAKAAKMATAVYSKKYEVLGGDEVLKKVSRADIDIIGKSINGEKVDPKKLNTAYKNYHQALKTVYDNLNDDVNMKDVNSNYKFLKSK